jgi:hypothetical protein
MNFFISYNQYKRENILNETYESYEELNELGDNIVKNYNKFSLFHKLRKYRVYPIKKFITKEFKTINDFIENFKLGTCYLPKPGPTHGSYIPKKDFKESFPVSETFLNSLLEKYDGIIMFNTLEPTTALHELQHAYDDYRSKGKYTETKQFNKYLKLEKPEDKFAASGTEAEVKDKIKNFLKKYRRWATSYSKLTHEKSAFFVEAIKKTDFLINTGKQGVYFRNINLVWDEFKKNYQSYDFLTPKMKKDAARKFSQYYYKLKEKYKDRLIQSKNE